MTGITGDNEHSFSKGSPHPGGAMDSTESELRAQAMKASNILRSAKDEAVETAKSKLKQEANTTTRKAATQMDGFAQSLHRLADDLSGQNPTIGEYAHMAADRVASFGQAIQSRDINDLMDEASNMACRQPLVFMGLAATAGFLVGRAIRNATTPQSVQGHAYGPHDRFHGQSLTGETTHWGAEQMRIEQRHDQGHNGQSHWAQQGDDHGGYRGIDRRHFNKGSNEAGEDRRSPASTLSGTTLSGGGLSATPLGSRAKDDHSGQEPYSNDDLTRDAGAGTTGTSTTGTTQPQGILGAADINDGVLGDSGKDGENDFQKVKGSLIPDIDPGLDVDLAGRETLGSQASPPVNPNDHQSNAPKGTSGASGKSGKPGHPSREH